MVTLCEALHSSSGGTHEINMMCGQTRWAIKLGQGCERSITVMGKENTLPPLHPEPATK